MSFRPPNVIKCEPDDGLGHGTPSSPSSAPGEKNVLALQADLKAGVDHVDVLE